METPPAEAVSTAVCAVVTAETVAVKSAEDDPCGTETDEGTATAELVLESATASPPDPAGAVRATVQVSVPAPVSELLLQVRLRRAPGAACAAPLSAMVADPVGAFVFRVIDPVNVPVVVGLNWMESVAVCPGFKVRGKAGPAMLKPAPVIEAAVIVRAEVPEEVTTIDFIAGDDPMVTVPKSSVLALRLSAATLAPS